MHRGSSKRDVPMHVLASGQRLKAVAGIYLVQARCGHAGGDQNCSVFRSNEHTCIEFMQLALRGVHGGSLYSALHAAPEIPCILSHAENMNP